MSKTIPRPDAEAAWLAWLAAGGFSASTQLPREHFDGMVRLSRVGGKRRNLVQDQVALLVEVWHSDPYTASTRAHELAALIESGAGAQLDPYTRCSDVDTSGPVEFPDPSSGRVRYQFTSSCVLRRTA